jgi:hypothetical protein
MESSINGLQSTEMRNTHRWRSCDTFWRSACFRYPLRFSDLNHAIKRDPRTGLRSVDDNWDFWSLLPEALFADLREDVGFGNAERRVIRKPPQTLITQELVQLPPKLRLHQSRHK